MDETRANDGLKYIGRGLASVVGVPARDLTAAEAAEHGRVRLLLTGLYAEYEAPISKKVYAPKPTKAALKGKEAEIKE